MFKQQNYFKNMSHVPALQVLGRGGGGGIFHKIRYLSGNSVNSVSFNLFHLKTS